MSTSKLFIGILTLIILSSLFYWFEWRPSQIRKECYENTKIKFNDSGRVQIQTVDTYYEYCLRKNGLEK